jgi:hypothetical protein
VHTNLTTNIDLYFVRGRLGFSRLTDLLNNTQGGFLQGALLAPKASDPDSQRELVVRLQDVLMVRPVEDQPALHVASSERRDRLPQRMVMDLDEWRVVGNLHLVDRVRWVDFIAGMSQRFLPVTDAEVLAPGSEHPLEYPFVLINGARVSALYEPA